MYKIFLVDKIYIKSQTPIKDFIEDIYKEICMIFTFDDKSVEVYNEDDIFSDLFED